MCYKLIMLIVRNESWPSPPPPTHTHTTTTNNNNNNTTTLRVLMCVIQILLYSHSGLVANMPGGTYFGAYGGTAGRPAQQGDVSMYGHYFYDVRMFV